MLFTLYLIASSFARVPFAVCCLRLSRSFVRARFVWLCLDPRAIDCTVSLYCAQICPVPCVRSFGVVRVRGKKICSFIKILYIYTTVQNWAKSLNR